MEQPPDFAYGIDNTEFISEWAFQDRLVDLRRPSILFQPVRYRRPLPRDLVQSEDRKEGALRPAGRSLGQLHPRGKPVGARGPLARQHSQGMGGVLVVLVRPDPPAVRKALGRDDIWGSAGPCRSRPPTTLDQFFQFLRAYDADYVTRDGKLVIDDQEIRERLVKAIDNYTAVYRKGCTPPNSLTWDDGGNNKAFNAQTVVMTSNITLSIVNALKREVPTITTRIPRRSNGQLVPLARPFRSKGASSKLRPSKTAATTPPPRSSSAFSWPKAG